MNRRIVEVNWSSSLMAEEQLRVSHKEGFMDLIVSTVLIFAGTRKEMSYPGLYIWETGSKKQEEKTT